MCCALLLSHVQLFVTPWTVTSQTPLSWAFSRQEYWSRLPCLPPGHFPNPEMGRQILDCLSYKEVNEYWSGQPIPSPGDLPNPGIEPGSPALQADSLPAEMSRKTSCSFRHAKFGESWSWLNLPLCSLPPCMPLDTKFSNSDSKWDKFLVWDWCVYIEHWSKRMIISRWWEESFPKKYL